MLAANPSIADEGPTSAYLLQQCERHLDAAKDGLLLGSWRLTFVNAAGKEQERVVLLTQHAVHRVNIDFKSATVDHITRLPIADIEKVVIGPLQWEGENSQKVAHMLGGASRASHASEEHKTRALRLVMSDAYADSADLGGGPLGFLSLRPRRERVDVKTTTFASKVKISRGGSKDAEPQNGPQSVLSFESAIRSLLSESGRSIVNQADVQLGVSPIGVAIASTYNDLKKSYELWGSPTELGVPVGQLGQSLTGSSRQERQCHDPTPSHRQSI